MDKIFIQIVLMLATYLTKVRHHPLDVSELDIVKSIIIPLKYKSVKN